MSGAPAGYIDGFHNPRRRHAALGFTSPTQFERGIAPQTALTQLKLVQAEASPSTTCSSSSVLADPLKQLGPKLAGQAPAIRRTIRNRAACRGA
ncbi:hypothetical protein MMSR116_18805 [Methylobacterium mesophilicum SR1.6/6]|uniref:Uncharacterized protein n=1 Tax=Methylobacterium mesophilicum SR1.6/6 TaxID=908290 RepID=A0A6B9FMT2_9HYPH|nr:hypothetical protein MMSR116_18805 [Methylobacterium mesophilicum SR1.6/6]